MSQTNRVLTYLKEKGSIDPLQAWTELGIYRLGARIYDLKKEHSIHADWKEVYNRFGEKIRVRKYTLINQQ